MESETEITENRSLLGSLGGPYLRGTLKVPYRKPRKFNRALRAKARNDARIAERDGAVNPAAVSHEAWRESISPEEGVSSFHAARMSRENDELREELEEERAFTEILIARCNFLFKQNKEMRDGH